MARDHKGAKISKFGTQLSELKKLADTNTLWHITSWGAATALALATAVLISATDIGARRLHSAVVAPAATTAVAGGEPLQGARMAQAPDTDRTGSIAPQRQVVTPNVVTPIPQAARPAETARLEAEIRQLAADRDRLKERVASLERNLNDMTGSIKRELALVAATASPPPPSVGAPATESPADSGRGDRVVDSPDDTARQVVRQAKSEARFVSKPDDESDTTSKAHPGTKAETAREQPPTDRQIKSVPGQPVVTLAPLPPVKTAMLPPKVHDPDTPEIGIELGGARSMEIMKKRWAAVKANFGPLIEGMHPLVTYDRRNRAIPYRLRVGPLANGAGAAALCKRFAAVHVSCRTTEFVGDVFADK